MRPLMLLLAIGSLAAADPKTATKPPSTEEAVLLTMVNQHRSQRQWLDSMIISAFRDKALPGLPLNWTRLGNDRSPKPPLALNQALVQAARGVLSAGTKTVERQVPDASAPLKAAEYTANGMLLLGSEQPSLDLAYASAMTLVIGDVTLHNRTYPEFQGAGLFKPTWRETGVAVNMSKGKFQVAILLGAGTAKRYIGGLAYLDANHNGSYDSGEGRGGVTVSVGTKSTTTGPAGTWSLALDTVAETGVTFTDGTYTGKRTLAAGTTNAAIDWRVPLPADIATAARLIAAVERDAKLNDPLLLRKSQAEMLLETRVALLDDQTQAKVAELGKPIREELDETLGKGLAALSEDATEFRKIIAALQKPWNGAAGAWFRELEKLHRHRMQVGAAMNADDRSKPKLIATAIKNISTAMASSGDPEFIKQYIGWRIMLEDAIPTEPAKK